MVGGRSRGVKPAGEAPGDLFLGVPLQIEIAATLAGDFGYDRVRLAC